MILSWAFGKHSRWNSRAHALKKWERTRWVPLPGSLAVIKWFTVMYSVVLYCGVKWELALLYCDVLYIAPHH